MGQYGPTVPRRRRISTRRLLLADLRGGGFAHSWMRGVRILESVCRLAGAGAGWTGGGVTDDRRGSSDAVSTLPHATSPARIFYFGALAALFPCRSDGARFRRPSVVLANNPGMAQKEFQSLAIVGHQPDFLSD